MSFINTLGSTIKGAAKVALLSRMRGAGRRSNRGGRVFVLGNGPSLRETLDAYAGKLNGRTCMGVNFAMNAPEIRALAPELYVLADPHFFKPEGENENVDALWGNLRDAGEMRLYVPAQYSLRAKARLGSGSRVDLRSFNAVGVEGFGAFARGVYRLGLGMPRPRNVLIPSLMLAIREGFSEIIILGADHSWMKTLGVTDENEVVSIQPHFYTEDSREEARVRHEYRGYRLHDIVESFAVAFRAYHQIADYAREEGVDIVNATPGSFIDAFRRGDVRDFL
ncbi:MAG: hypothetical protein K2M06_08100 [Muribaculaceae bacterium]|nr:hypothetical protein [Muribaculaceae bacterium]